MCAAMGWAGSCGYSAAVLSLPPNCPFAFCPSWNEFVPSHGCFPFSFFVFFCLLLKMAVFEFFWVGQSVPCGERSEVSWAGECSEKMCTLEVTEENSSILYVTKDYRWAQSLRLSLPVNSYLSLKFPLLFSCSGFNWMLNLNHWMEVFPLNNGNSCTHFRLVSAKVLSLQATMKVCFKRV